MEENNFKILLNKYLEILNCSAKKLSQTSQLSESAISRYRTGEKLPKQGSKQIEKLINGLIIIAKEQNVETEKIINDFNNALQGIDFEILRNNFNELITILKINVADISRYLGYDPSYLSKIRSGIRKPFYIDEFVNSICEYISHNYNDVISKQNISSLIGKKINDNFELELKKWLCSNDNVKNEENKINHFLTELNNFNLDDYIKVIHFDELKVPSFPFKFPKSKNYYGLEEMKQAELDFLKSVVLSKNGEDVFMCSDMQMDDMTNDIEFSKKWMFGMAMMLKKGLSLNIIHNVDRPFNEMMLGLESWIPLYMTGKVTPYYFRNYNDKIYSHLNYVSGDYVLYGECIKGYHKKGKYYLTNNKSEVEYYKEKAKFLLNKASSLMEIHDELKDFYEKDELILSNRKRILSGLPFHTLSEKLFEKILKNNNISSKKQVILKKYLQKEKSYIEKVTKENMFVDEICFLNEKDFKNNNVVINIGKYEKNLELKYNYKEYLEHFSETEKYKNKNYKLIINKKSSFSNIDIYINKGEYAIISKRNNPCIHFVIRHEKLVNAIENFEAPVTDN